MCVGIVKFDQRLPNFSEKGGGSGQQDSSQATLVFDTPELGDVLFSILYVTLCSLRSAIAIKTGADTTVWSQAAEHHSAEGFHLTLSATILTAVSTQNMLIPPGFGEL